MKKYFILLSLFYSINSFTQDYRKIDTVLKKIYYDYTFQVDSTDASSEKYQEMVLLVGKHSSEFSSKNMLYTDSVLYEGRNKDMNNVLAKLIPQMGQLRVHHLCEYIIYKNYPQKENVRFIGILGPKSTLIVDEIQKLTWNLIANRDTTIGLYHCKMATCNFAGRNYQAW
ncbi:GLPGLI family protein, partial [Marinifilum sp. D737]|uniref:GLPGLI family protein n=1 Tax=Marinifilum sp. D737 TaxID=2969628 RepID=UPI002275218B